MKVQDSLRFPLPEDQVERALEWLREPYEGPEPKQAAAVIFLRESQKARVPFEVYMVRRAQTMAHTPGVYAFPGGSIRPDDEDSRIFWRGPQLNEWANTMKEDQDTARRMLVAGAREVFEESRILVATYEDGSGVIGGESWEEERRALENHKLCFGDFLEKHRLVLDFSRTAFRGLWTTPHFLKRRYTVAFFTVVLPDGQEPILASSEANLEQWASPHEYLEQVRRGDISLVAPTHAHLSELAKATSIEEVLNAKGCKVMFEPVIDPHMPSGLALVWQG